MTVSGLCRVVIYREGFTDALLALGSWADEMDDLPLPSKLQFSHLLIFYIACC